MRKFTAVTGLWKSVVDVGLDCLTTMAIPAEMLSRPCQPRPRPPQSGLEPPEDQDVVLRLTSLVASINNVIAFDQVGQTSPMMSFWTNDHVLYYVRNVFPDCELSIVTTQGSKKTCHMTGICHVATTSHLPCIVYRRSAGMRRYADALLTYTVLITAVCRTRLLAVDRFWSRTSDGSAVCSTGL